jgi:hypothetical protein
VQIYVICGNPLKYTDPDGRSDENGITSPVGPPPSTIPGAGKNGWKFYPDPRNSRGGVWRPDPTPEGGEPQPDASYENPHGNTVGHWDVNDGKGNRQRYLPNGTPITPDQAHGKEPLPNPEGESDTSNNNRITDPNYTSPRLTEPKLTNPDFIPSDSSRTRNVFPPVFIIPVPSFGIK